MCNATKFKALVVACVSVNHVRRHSDVFAFDDEPDALPSDAIAQATSVHFRSSLLPPAVQIYARVYAQRFR